MITVTETQPLPLKLATSNGKKVDQLRRIPSLDISPTTPLFDESQIKQEITIPEDDGISYAGAVSRKKLEWHRKRAREQEGTGQDYAIIASDSVILVNDGENDRPVNRDGISDEEKQRILDTINRQREVTFVGAVSFGRKNGKSAFTVSTFMTLPLGEPISSFPLIIDELPDKKDPDRQIKYGYIKYGVAKDGGLVHRKKPLEATDSFAQARPFISGLTEDVIRFANDTAQFDRLTAPVAEDLVSRLSFNTVAFYSLAKQMGVERDGLASFYREISQSYDSFFETQGGGNCALFSLELAKKLREMGMDPRIASYASLNFRESGAVEDGHSGIVVDYNQRQYLFDPGLSITFPIPIGEIPISPFFAGGNKSFVVGLNDNNPVPQLFVLKKDARYQKIAGSKIFTVEHFQDRLGKVLTSLHDERSRMKIDFHNSSGRKTIGFLVDRNTLQLSIKLDGSDDPFEVNLRDLFSGSGKQILNNITGLCNYYGIDAHLLMEQLKGLIN